jgi:hypothetical protein
MIDDLPISAGNVFNPRFQKPENTPKGETLQRENNHRKEKLD